MRQGSLLLNLVTLFLFVFWSSVPSLAATYEKLWAWHTNYSNPLDTVKLFQANTRTQRSLDKIQIVQCLNSIK